MKKIAFIGAGNMGSALIRGLVNSNVAKAENIVVFDTDLGKVDALKHELGIRGAKDIAGAVNEGIDVVVLAVKPQVMDTVLEQVADRITDNHLMISLAAGVPTGFILSRLKKPARVVRTMPNAAAMSGQSATALCKAGTADEEDLRAAVNIFSAVGVAVPVEEKLMNVVTGLSGSGPAYIFAIMEGMTDAGVLLGLDRATARKLTVQTVLGAATMASTESVHLGELKDRITSPGGTTIAGLHVLERSGLGGILMDAVAAATRRGDELEPK
ncbi:MAG: pyrroline-5-carboxylate reductase [Desulfomonilaceae bacterium]|nr:pyrroline-5-carboxylate reductase [Desulfomonilaceae bacterium]